MEPYGKFDFGTLPCFAGSRIWDFMEVLDVFILAITSDATTWFTRNVIKRPQLFSVRFDASPSRYQNNWHIKMVFPDEKTFDWFIYPYVSPIKGSIITVKLGRQSMISTVKTEGPTTSLHSYLVDYKEGLFETIDVLCEIFNSQPSNIVMDELCDREFNEIEKWTAPRTVASLTTGISCSSSYLKSLLKERYAKNLATTFKGLSCRTPSTVTLEELQKVKFISSELNLKHFSEMEIVEFVGGALNDDLRKLNVRLPPVSQEWVNLLKERLGLLDRDCPIREYWGHKPRNWQGKCSRLHLRLAENTYLLFFLFSAVNKEDVYVQLNIERMVHVSDRR